MQYHHAKQKQQWILAADLEDVRKRGAERSRKSYYKTYPVTPYTEARRQVEAEFGKGAREPRDKFMARLEVVRLSRPNEQGKRQSKNERDIATVLREGTNLDPYKVDSLTRQAQDLYFAKIKEQRLAAEARPKPLEYTPTAEQIEQRKEMNRKAEEAAAQEYTKLMQLRCRLKQEEAEAEAKQLAG